MFSPYKVISWNIHLPCHAKHVTPSRRGEALSRGWAKRNPRYTTAHDNGVREDRTRITHGSWMCNRAAVGVILGAFRSPHSRLRRQCGVIYNVTARAVNIDGFQFITLIWHPTLNRASGCNLNNLALTTSRAQSATWGKQNTLHKTTTVERLQIQPLYSSTFHILHKTNYIHFRCIILYIYLTTNKISLFCNFLGIFIAYIKINT